MAIITRRDKGTKLTIDEMDGNFTYLDSNISTEISNRISVDSSLSSSLSLYLPLSGGTLTNNLNLNITDSSFSGLTSSKIINNNILRTSGNTSTVTEGFYMNNSYSGTTRVSGVYGMDINTKNLSIGQIDNLYGVMSYVRNDAAAYVVNMVSGYFSARNSANSGGYFNKMLGCQSFVNNYSSNALNNDIYGFATTVTNNISSFTDGMVGFDASLNNYGTINSMQSFSSYFSQIGTVNQYVIGLEIGSDIHPWGNIISVPKLYGIYIHKSVSGGTDDYAIYSDTTAKSYIKGSLNIGVTGSTSYKLNISGDTLINGKLLSSSSIKVSNDTTVASLSNVGSIRYTTSGTTPNTYSNCEMVMQTGTSTYSWVLIKQSGPW